MESSSIEICLIAENRKLSFFHQSKLPPFLFFLDVMEVPVIDISLFLADSLKSNSKHPNPTILRQKEQVVVNQVKSACESHGFFYISGLDDPSITIMSKAISQMKNFFDHENWELMNHYKKQCSSKNSKLYRGYTQTGGGNNCVSASKIPELKESFTVGAEGEGKSPMHGPNLWPSPVNTNNNKNEQEFCQLFRQDMMDYYAQLLQISRHVAHVLALSLDLPSHFFTNRMTDPVAQLVAFKYPPEDEDDDEGKCRRQISCGEHTDCGFLTLLVQTSPGLEVYSQGTKTWHIVKPVENAILVNLGDLTQSWTKGKYKSTPHRVHNISRGGKRTDRYSLVFFANCDFDASLDDLDSTDKNETDENENDVAVITAGKYMLERLGLMWLMGDDNS